MRKTVVVTSITAKGHQRIVRLTDINSGEVRELLYGDSVTELRIRALSPFLFKHGKTIKQGDK